MTKAELIEKCAGITELPAATVRKVLDACAEVARDELSVIGGEAILPGLGKITVKNRASRIGRNPRTGEEVDIPAKRVAHFSPSKALKDAVAK